MARRKKTQSTTPDASEQKIKLPAADQESAAEKGMGGKSRDMSSGKGPEKTIMQIQPDKESSDFFETLTNLLNSIDRNMSCVSTELRNLREHFTTDGTKSVNNQNTPADSQQDAEMKPIILDFESFRSIYPREKNDGEK